MNYLVTGGAGFIGSHLVDCLLKNGHTVKVLDTLKEGKMENLDLYNPNLTLHIGSVVDPIEFTDIDVVFHLAAFTRPQESVEKPRAYHRVNVEGTLNVLLWAKKTGVKRVVFASSACVYGEQEKYPCAESSKANPITPYALHKLIGEEYCELFTNVYGLQTNCLRLFNVYGPRMNPDSSYGALIPVFIKKIKNGETPMIYGDGNQARDFVHVSDVVEALILASQCEAYGEVINVGSGKNFSVNRISKLLHEKLGKEEKVIHGVPMAEPTQTLADITKASKLLNWNPKISLEEGIQALL